MAYQTGAANSVSDLLDKLAIFAAPLGWVIDKFEPGALPQLFLHNDKGYWSLGGVTAGHLYGFGNTGYDASKNYYQQPGSSWANHGSYGTYYGAGTTDLVGAFVSYDFFGTADYLHVVVQIGAAAFRHFGIGTLLKEGSYAGGQYAYGTRVSGTYAGRPDVGYHTYPLNDAVNATYGSSYYTAVVRADNLGGSALLPHWYMFGSPGAGVGAFGLGAPVTDLTNRWHPDTLAVTSSQGTLGAIIAPMPNAIIISGADGLRRRIGTVEDFYICRMAGIAPRAKFEINGDTWMIIPPLQYRLTTDNYTDGGNNSYIIGYAYRMV